MLTTPAFALSEVVLYFSCPSGLAARLSFCTAPAAPAAALETLVVAAAAGVVAAAAGVLDELELFDELPQPASASTSSTRAGTDARRRGPTWGCSC